MDKFPYFTDKQLVIFLNCCQCNIECTKKKLDSYYTTRTRTPEMFANRQISELLKTFDVL